ncbi:hypothetical protein QP185_07790 [Sphingomonas aerolata]
MFDVQRHLRDGGIGRRLPERQRQADYQDAEEDQEEDAEPPTEHRDKRARIDPILRDLAGLQGIGLIGIALPPP